MRVHGEVPAHEKGERDVVLRFLFLIFPEDVGGRFVWDGVGEGLEVREDAVLCDALVKPGKELRWRLRWRYAVAGAADRRFGRKRQNRKGKGEACKVFNAALHGGLPSRDRYGTPG